MSMRMKQLLEQWQSDAAAPRAAKVYEIRLPLFDAAKIAALSELFPGRSEEQILTDLLSAALDQIEAEFPYERGPVAEVDEEGDPIYADAGLTPRYRALIDQHVERLKNSDSEGGGG